MRVGGVEVAVVPNTGKSSGIIRVLVPMQINPGVPETVAVTITVDGIEAATPRGPLQFTYTFPQPFPSITDFTTGDPDRPRWVPLYESFDLTLYGSHFLSARRTPQRCIAWGPNSATESVSLVGHPTSSSVTLS